MLLKKHCFLLGMLPDEQQSVIHKPCLQQTLTERLPCTRTILGPGDTAVNQTFPPLWNVLSYGDWFSEVVVLLSSSPIRNQAGNCLISGNRAGCLEQVSSPSQRCWRVGWVAAYWGCGRGDLSAGQGFGFVMVKFPFWRQDGRIAWMDLFWDSICFVKYHTWLLSV